MGTVTRRYEVLSRQKLSWPNVLTTYFFGWVVFPLLLFGPLGGALAVFSIMVEAGTDTPWLSLMVILPAVGWMVAAIWKLVDWDDRRGLPAPSGS